MKNQEFNYEEVFMGVRRKKPKTYKLSFYQDYRIRSLVKSIKLETGKLLDIGCGGGTIAESLPYYYPKVAIYGCDVSNTAIKFAKQLGSGKVKYSLIKNKTFPYRSDFFDVCICFDVLEHVPDVDFFLKEVKRVLKKNGAFFLIVPCEGQPFTYTWFFQKIKYGQKLTYNYYGHIHPEFTHNSVLALLKNHGFRLGEISYSEHFFYQIIHLLIYFLPKGLLGLFLGEKGTKEYSDSGLIASPKNESNPLMIIRKFLFTFFELVKYPMNWETILLRNIPTTAWKLHVVGQARN